MQNHQGYIWRAEARAAGRAQRDIKVGGSEVGAGVQVW
jgi:hypothetical protein